MDRNRGEPQRRRGRRERRERENEGKTIYGENVTTDGIDLLGLPTGTRLHLGNEAIITITGLRDPCAQLDQIQPGLMAAVLGRDAQGNLICKAGIMAVDVTDGLVRPGDAVAITLPPPHHPLESV